MLGRYLIELLDETYQAAPDPDAFRLTYGQIAERLLELYHEAVSALARDPHDDWVRIQIRWLEEVLPTPVPHVWTGDTRAHWFADLIRHHRTRRKRVLDAPVVRVGPPGSEVVLPNGFLDSKLLAELRSILAPMLTRLRAAGAPQEDTTAPAGAAAVESPGAVPTGS
jgi:hypothetical protein